MDEEKKKISFIINPKSGTQSKEQILHLLDEKLDKAKYVQEVIYTEYAGPKSLIISFDNDIKCFSFSLLFKASKLACCAIAFIQNIVQIKRYNALINKPPFLIDSIRTLGIFTKRLHFIFFIFAITAIYFCIFIIV